MTPSSINMRPGTSVWLDVYALRKDGFAGEISLAWKDPPKGFSLSGVTIPAGKDQTRFALSVPQTPVEAPVPLRVEGRATIDGREVVRRAVPADDMMQAFIYHHLVPANDCFIAMFKRELPRIVGKLLDSGPAKIPSGGTATIRATVPRESSRPLRFSLRDAPWGISIQEFSMVKDTATIVLQADAKKAKLGQKGRLTIDVSVEKPAKTKDLKTPATKKARSLGSLPAVPYEVVAPP
jgi:hypothetical protein